jgi:hypothetical protein
MLRYEFIEDNTQSIQNPSLRLDGLRDTTSYIAHIKYVLPMSKEMYSYIGPENLPTIAAVWKWD